MTHQEEKKAVAVSALIFAFGTFLSRILGLVREAMTARYFPIEVRDAFVVAFRLPNLFRRLLGEGSLSVSFIPVFVEVLNDGDMARARRLVNGIFAILTSLSITLTLLGIAFMDDIIRVWVSGEEYMSVPGKFEMTVRLGRIMFVFLLLISLYAFFMAVLNSLKKFAVTALAPCLFNVALIAAALVSNKLAAPENALAWAVVAGGFLQMAALLPGTIRAGFFPRLTFKWNTPEVRRVLKSVLPSIFGMSVLQVTTLANVYFASHLPQGAHSYLYFADRILELPLAIFVVSVGSALMPTLAKYWAQGNREAMADTINHYLRLILFVSLPAAFGMFALAQPITEVLFLGGEFKLADAIATAQVIQVYSFSVIVSAGVRILAQGFYAIKNTWFPAVAATVSVISHLLFAWVLTREFGLLGLASASVLSATVNLVMLTVAYNAWIGRLEGAVLARGLAKFLVCVAVMLAVLQVYAPLLHGFGGRYFPKWMVLLTTIGAGGLAYFAAAHVLKVPEYHETAATFGAKIKNRLRSMRRK